MAIRILFFLILLLGAHSINGQDYGWWNDLVKWDGKTPWQEYMQLSSGGLGPNALPVPEFHTEKLGNNTTFELREVVHFHPQEFTTNLFLRAEFSFLERVAIKAWIVPLEYYNTSDELRDERKIRQFEPKGFGIGDLYFGTYIKVLEENERQPYILFSANFKTASGNNIEAGRVTETPGYYFDLLFSKTISLTPNWTIKPYAAGGLYVYQTFDGLHFQNDAFLYGSGIKILVSQSSLDFELAGYSGYLNIRDQPIMLRSNFVKKLKEAVILQSGIQIGLRDSKYTSIHLGIKYIVFKSQR